MFMAYNREVECASASYITVRMRTNTPEEYDSSAEDPQVQGKGTIVLYRRGGSFSDALYRRVAVLDTAGPLADTVFIDNIPDSDIASNPTVDFDNDRPVTGNLPTPFRAKISGGSGGEVGAVSYTWDAATWPLMTAVEKITFEVEVDSGLESTAPNLIDVLYPGSIVRIGAGVTNATSNKPIEEFCVVNSVDYASLTFTVVVQSTGLYGHVVGEVVETSSRANIPCRFACTAFNSIFLAGDRYNPNVLYKSKIGRPEAFPATINFSDGSPGSIEVGTPSDPIMNITEYDGKVLCLNRSHLYVVQVYTNGYMQEPMKTLAQRGLMGSWAWCKADNEIWYLAYDGIYSWSGGESAKRSEAIDPIFRGEYFNGFYPISYERNPGADVNGLSDLDKVLFHYRNNQVFVTYVDTQGTTRRMRYDLIYNRWDSEDIAADSVLFEEDTGRLLFATNSAGVAKLNLDDTPISALVPSTTDGWDAAEQNDGTAISWEAWTGWYMMGMPSMQKQFGDLIVELQNHETAVSVEVYYDYSDTPAETFTIDADAAIGRRREVLSLRAAASQEAYAISLRFTGTSIEPVTLYSLTFNFLTLEQIQHGRASDWDNLGYPHDKRLQQVSFEYDVGGTNATLYLDTMNGIGGATQNLAVQTFTLSSPVSTTATGPTRARTTFPINDGIVAKLVRLRPSETSHDIKVWEPHFDFIQYPPDKCLFTEWQTLDGWPCESVLREVILEVDTGSTPATVNVQADGVTKRTFNVQTSMDTRHQIVTLNRSGDEELIGKQFRLLNSPAVEGKFQLFSYKLQGLREPCGVTHWWSLEQNFGFPGFKFIKACWLMYKSCAPVMFRVYADSKLLLLEEELPQHDRRDVERIYLPDVSSSGVLNKSRVYMFEMESLDPCCGFKQYADGSFIHWMPFAADMRQAYQNFGIFEPMERSIMP
jgi:hypothetical protein